MRRLLLLLSIALVLSLSGASATWAAVFFDPNTAYLSVADIPVGFYAGSFTLENFEDGNLVAGVTGSPGGPLSPGMFTDSVDGDSGPIDGFSSGWSWYSGGANAITFTFTGPTLPTAVGIVWTDGAGTVTFEAFGNGMVLLGSLGPKVVPNNPTQGASSEDRFYGVRDLAGIKAIRISNSSPGIEVDHLSFGAAPATATPEPSTLLMMAAGSAVICGLSTATRRRKPLA